MSTPTPTQKPAPLSKPFTEAKTARLPSIGDSVLYVGWWHGEGAMHGVVSHVYGLSTVNLAYLTPGGTWMSGSSVKYDPRALAGGSWHWPAQSGVDV